MPVPSAWGQKSANAKTGLMRPSPHRPTNYAESIRECLWGRHHGLATEVRKTPAIAALVRASCEFSSVYQWRNAADCALVFEAIRGTDGQDLSVRDFPFNYDHRKNVKTLRVGVLRDEINSDNSANYQNDSSFIALMETQGIELIDKQLPQDIPTSALRLILLAETGAAFDELTRSDRDSLLVRQDRYAWPTTFRASRLIPAVEYIQANRLRSALTQQFNEIMRDIDVLIAPSFGIQLTMTNLTGHPCIALPNGSYANGDNGSITLIGNHFDEASILRFARFVQEITPYEEEQPPLFR